MPGASTQNLDIIRPQDAAGIGLGASNKKARTIAGLDLAQTHLPRRQPETGFLRERRL